MTDFYDATVANIPMGRMGTNYEIADTVAFLASPRSAFTTGTNVVVDGALPSACSSRLRRDPNEKPRHRSGFFMPLIRGCDQLIELSQRRHQ